MKLHWGNALVIFFTIFLTLAFSFIVFSLKQNNDLEVENYYEKGATYSKQIEIDKRSNFLTDSISIEQSMDNIKIIFAEYLVNNALQMQIHFYRPSNKKYDYMVNINTLKPIEQIGKSKLAIGRYIVKFTWQIDHADYALEQTVFVE